MRCDDLFARQRRQRLAALRAVLDADLGVEQAQVVVDLGHGRHRRLLAAAAEALLDRDGRRHAGEQIDVGPRQDLHVLARIGGEAVQIAALPLGVDDVEGESRLPRAAQSGDDDQLIARQVEGEIAQVVLLGADDAHASLQLQAQGLGDERRRVAAGQRRAGERLAQVAGGVRCRLLRHLFGSSLGDDRAAASTALRTEIDDVVGRFGDLHVVLDDDHRVAAIDQALQGGEELVDVGEMEADRRLVEEKERVGLARPGEGRRQLEALRLAAGKRYECLAEPQIAEADLEERRQALPDLGRIGEEIHRVLGGGVEHLADGLALVENLEHLLVEAGAVAGRDR